MKDLWTEQDDAFSEDWSFVNDSNIKIVDIADSFDGIKTKYPQYFI
jgi:hypothetical protein